MDDVWLVVPVPGNARRTGGTCDVEACDAPVYDLTVNLCHAHTWQWKRAGRPQPVEDWLPEARAKRVVKSKQSLVDFTAVPDLVAHEIRYVVGTKITSGDWTENAALRTLVQRLIAAAAHVEARSLFDRKPTFWTSVVFAMGPHAAIKTYVKTFFSTLHRTAVSDPWAENTWVWRHTFELVLGNPRDEYNQSVDWSRVSQPWLRDPAKQLAKKVLLSGERKWATIVTWCRALAHFSSYLAVEGIEDPGLIDRDLFLDYLLASREGGASKHAKLGINTSASILADLRAHGFLPDLASEIYLRRGENKVDRKAKPKPFPADIVERIDVMLDEDTEIDPIVRIMLKFNRWGGLRISELVSLPVDCLRVTPRGYVWVEYYMSKTDEWRRFPLMDDLATLLREQQRFVRENYGPDAPFMFPSLNRSSRSARVVRPWSASGLRNHTARAFVRNGIIESALTGERVKGSSIHRFRHTIGTALLNNNWTMSEVQAFFTHKSDTMSGHYAKIVDDTLNRKMAEFHAQQRLDQPKPGEPHESPVVEHMRAKFTAVLPNGLCRLPEPQHCDYRKIPCYSCSFYDDGGEQFRPVHEQHRRMLQLFVVEHTDEPAKVAINQANLDALDARIPEVS